ncbi:MAG: hypothetical protein ORN49_01615 [Rhodobacteraceae bacterium]|nr:hypothetical protein [Paracoccaceae bacterium]
MRLRKLALWSCAALGLVAAAQADQPMYYAPEGIALSGYDVVAYFTEGRPVAGSAEHAIKWRGAVWYFHSPESEMSFEMNPEAYAPQFGGYCAYAVAEGRTASVQPGAFFVRDGRLYFMHTEEMLRQKQAELTRIVTQAQGNWPHVLILPPAGDGGQDMPVADGAPVPDPNRQVVTGTQPDPEAEMSGGGQIDGETPSEDAGPGIAAAEVDRPQEQGESQSSISSAP